MAYTNNTLVGNFLKRALTSDEVAMLAILEPAIKIWIDLKTGTTFDQEAAYTKRLYDGGTQFIDIDPCTDIQAIELVDDYGVVNYNYQSYEYVLEPANFNVKTGLKYRYGAFISGTNRVRVTAKFSSYDGTVPEDIQVVATRLCGVLLNAKVAAGVRLEDLEGHRVQYDLTKYANEDPMIMSILDLRRDIMLG